MLRDLAKGSDGREGAGRCLPSAQAARVSGNDGLRDRAVLLKGILQVLLIGIEDNVTDEQRIWGLVGVVRFDCLFRGFGFDFSFKSTMSGMRP